MSEQTDTGTPVLDFDFNLLAPPSKPSTSTIMVQHALTKLSQHYEEQFQARVANLSYDCDRRYRAAVTQVADHFFNRIAALQ